MNVLIDENLSPRLKRFFKERGHEAMHVSDVGLVGAKDSEVWAFTISNVAVLITQDADFDSRPSANSAGSVVRLTLGNAATPEVLAWLQRHWPDAERQLAAGARLVVA